MYRRQQTGTVIETVRHDGDIAHCRDRKDFAQLGDAPHFGGAWLHKVHRSRSHEPFEVHESRDILSCGDGDAARSSQLSKTIIIFWWPDRLLQPFQAEFLELPRSCSSFAQRPGTVHVNGELDVGADLFTGGSNRRELYFVQFQT